MHKCSRGRFDWFPGNHPPKRIIATSQRRNRRVALSNGRDGNSAGGFRLHAKMNGATTIAPKASPSHHVSQRFRKFCQEAEPATHRLAVPMEALTAGPTMAANKTNRKTPLS